MLNGDLMRLMEHGILRFRVTPDNKTPRPFCWDTEQGKGQDSGEYLSDSHVEYNLSYSIPFHRDGQSRGVPLNRDQKKILMLSGSAGSGYKLHQYMYMSISKAYYATRHGYPFILKLSPQYVEYFPDGIFDAINHGMAKTPYFRGVMSKPVMVLDAMYSYLDYEWILWSDDDTFINPGWLYLPLESFLSDVPDDKVLVMTNARSVFTNIFFIRNNFKGRKLVRDWISIVMSGYIECHGFDQAAMQILILNRILKDEAFQIDNPFNYSCFHSKDQDTGCNDVGQWTCDFKFEVGLYNAGFKSKYHPTYEYGKMSSFSKVWH